MHESEYMIGEASCVCVMLFDPQVGFMVEQAVQHVGRVANGGIDDLRMKGVRARNGK